MTDLATRIAAARLADTHEHQSREPDFVEHGPDILQDLFTSGYITSDLIVAGAAPDDVQRLVEARDEDVADRFRAIESAWHCCQHTGYGEAVRYAAQAVYGIEHISADALAAAADRAYASQRPGERLRILRDVANLAFVDIDYATWDCAPDPSGPDFFFEDISWFGLCNGEVDAAKLHGEVGVDVKDCETLRAALAAIFTRYADVAIAVKAQHAYERTLRWSPRSDAEVGPVLRKRLVGRSLEEAEQQCLGDWCWARGVELSIEHGLPFKIHTGHHAGHGRMILEHTRPAHLSPILAAYPQARFVLMHAGYPFGPELLSLAKHFPNVWVDLCWAWALDPYTTAEMFRRALHSMPMSKLFAFGGDCVWPTQAVGYARQCRVWLTHALHAEVATGWLTEPAAIEVANRVMHVNAEEFFDVAARACADA